MNKIKIIFPWVHVRLILFRLLQIFHCTAGHEGAIGDLSCMSIFSACFGLPTTVQLPATTWSGQIWISCWILPHFDVRTISVAWKLKKLSNIFWQKIFFLLHPLSKSVAPLCTVEWSGDSIQITPPLKKAIPRLEGPLFSQKPRSERTPTDSEYDVGWFKTTQNFWDIYTNIGFYIVK